MTATLGSGPVPLSRVWTRSRVIAEDLTGEDLSDVLELHSDASGWWVLPRADRYAVSELHAIAEALDLDDLAVSDLLADDRRAKFEAIGQSRLVMTNAVTVDRDRSELTVHPVSIIVTDRALICLAEPCAAFQPGQLLRAKEAELATGGVEAAFQLLVSAIVASYEEAVSWLEDSTDDLADVLFEERPLEKPEQLHAFRLRSSLSQLRRVTDPMRTVLADVVANPPSAVKNKTRDSKATRRWTMLAERHGRAANAADALREALASVFDTSLALADLRMNQAMKKLTAWAAIIAVPTLVTGFVGMNVSFPGDGTTVGFWFYFALMLAASAVLYVVFKVKDWV